MLSRQVSGNSQQISDVLDTMITALCKPKRISWHSRGISDARIFEIEPWRKIGRKPFSIIRNSDKFSAVPYRLPDTIKEIKPYFDYSTYAPPPEDPPYNLRQRPLVPETDYTSDYTSDDSLPRSRCISLDEVYKISTQMLQGQDYEQFIENSEIELGYRK